ncbi:MAG: FAD-dependent oxidoreductase, partial [Thermoflavifilum sp.]|nr:FAD-dependent oxidoreductase [Thermoflavifilum sp.]
MASYSHSRLSAQVFDTLIIGAGAAGLQCGVELAEAGQHVLILEARDRAGGRIHTFRDPHTGYWVEAGAEFIHGHLPLTFQWINRLGLPIISLEGSSLHLGTPQPQDEEVIEAHWQLFWDKLHAETEDIPLLAFLDRYFSDTQFSSLRRQVLQYAMGYDAADPARVSVLALRAEWSQPEARQYRIPTQQGGYGRLIEGMLQRYQQAGGNILFQYLVKQIDFSQPDCVWLTADHTRQIFHFRGNRVICTIPPGVFQQASPAAPHIWPKGNELIDLLCRLGFGRVVKIVTLWKRAWWEEIWGTHLSFLFTNQPIPTWWTAHPEKTPMLTGWLPGDASALSGNPRNLILMSLSKLAGTTREMLDKICEASYIFDWFSEYYSCGSYSFPTPGLTDTIEALHQLFPNRLYFAGEGYDVHPPWGTVE